MKEQRKCVAGKAGVFLPRGQQRIRCGRWLAILVLLAWDGLLLYMIVDCLIEPVYGAAFVAVVSFYMGYKI